LRSSYGIDEAVPAGRTEKAIEAGRCTTSSTVIAVSTR